MTLSVQDIAFKSAMELREMLRSGQASAAEICEATLAYQAELEPSLNCFVTATPELARAAAAAAPTDDPQALLAGIPLSVKDNIAVAGVRQTNGSRALADNVAREDAVVVQRARAAGGVIIGKTTMSEFGCKPVGDSPLTGISRNPWDTSRNPGGSSAGAAASVAAGLTPFAIATDGGGSARVPASFCGLFGLKPQYGRIPVVPPAGAPTVFHTGVVSRSVADAALLLTSLAGSHVQDCYSLAEPVPDFLAACRGDVRGLRVAFSPTLGYGQPAPAIMEAMVRTAKVLEGLGCEVDYVNRVLLEDPMDIWVAEFATSAGTRMASILEEQAELLDPMVVEMLGRVHSTSLKRYWELSFKRHALKVEMRQFFSNYDVLLTATAPVLPFAAGDNGPIPGDRSVANTFGWLNYAYPFNLTGQPAASVPAGLSTGGLPIGVQLIAGEHQEQVLFRIASALEQVEPWAYRVQPSGHAA